MKINELFSVRGRVVLITGGSRGIGEMMARGFVENGAKVYISSRKADACEALAAQLSAYGECFALPADLADMVQVREFSQALAARESKLDVLINNAGASWGAPIDDFPEAGWDKVMDLNVKSVFFLTQQVLSLLRAAASDDYWARVINIGSIEGLHVSALDAASYSASKAAVNHLSRVLAAKLAPDRIACNAIAPGYFPTKMTAGLPDGVNQEVMEKAAIKRLGTPEDMAGIALYLASRASSYVTGAIIPVDGGLYTTS